jgi:IMP dehydrogenase
MTDFRPASECLYNRQALSFDDVLLIPQHSNVPSREDPNLETKLTRNVSIKHPIVATNMSTVTESEMMVAMWESGSFGILHRFMDLDAFQEQMFSIVNRVASMPRAISVGVKGEELDEGWLEYNDISVVLVDVAHGDSGAVVSTIKRIKNEYPHIDVIGGNIATRDGFKRMVDAGADGVRVGIGGGSACTTRLVTGHGLPTLASVIDCAEASHSSGVPMIADGGIRNSGDIVKALAFGASAVCVGNMLAGTSETPGAVLTLPNGDFKEYYGMSSHTAQNRHKSGKRRGIAAEGIDKLVPYKGNTTDVLDEILGGVRSGLSYSGAFNISQLRENVEYVILTAGSMKESKFGNGAI